MNEVHFTPGPLKADLGEAYKVREANGAQVAIVTHLHLKGRRPSSETAANTHLFAAAPDLYAALEMLANEASALHDYCEARFTETEMELDAGLGEPMAGVHVCLYEARAALKKARGES